MVNDSNSSGNCGCGTGTSSSSKKEGGECSEKSGSEKSPFAKDRCCPKPNKLTGKEEPQCHSSHEQFKNDNDKCQSENKSSKKDKKTCHDSHKAFSKGTEGEDVCLSSKENNSEKRKGPCPSPLKSVPPSKKEICDTAYSKVSKYCKNLAKQYVKLKPKSECSGADTVTLGKDICDKRGDLPVGQSPCHPIAEKGVILATKATCTSKVTCPHLKKPSLSNFFPIDARNKQLNECIEKYMKIDPSQVISKCSQFANITSDMSEKCLESVKKSQLKCVQSVKKSQQKCLQSVKGSEAAKRTSQLISARSLQLTGRWAPSAAMYLATTALVTVYVTEWKAILKYVPFYSQSALQDVSAPL